MKKCKEELAVELLAMTKSEVIQLFLMITLEHKKALEQIEELKYELKDLAQ